VGKKSRIIGIQLTDNVMRYTDSTTNTVVPIDIKSFESSSGYNIFDIKVADNVYYGKAAALIDANTSRITLNLRNNRNLNASTYQNNIPDTLPTATFAGSVMSQNNNSVVIGRTNKTRGSASLVIDDENGVASSVAIYQKTGVYVPLLNLYNSNGSLVSSLNVDGSASFTSVKLAVNRITNTNGTPSSGSYVIGDVVLNSAPSISKPVTHWHCIADGTPGTWQQAGHIVYTGTTAQRPVLIARDAGVMFFDTTLAANGKPIWWTGSKWVDASGNPV
jgi:hypothetical protein